MDFAAHFNKLNVDQKRQQDLEHWQAHEKTILHRRSSIAQQPGGVHQQQLYEQNYGTSQPPPPQQQQHHSNPQRQRELENWHAHQTSLQRRGSTYNPTGGKELNKMYKQHYGSPQAQASQPPPTQSQSQQSQQSQASQPPNHRTQTNMNERNHHTGKAQLAQAYEYKMHNQNNREYFAVTMNNNAKGDIMRSGVLSVLPRNSGPKHITPGVDNIDPTAAGGRTLTKVIYEKDGVVTFRPHEKQVSPGFIEGSAGQSSNKLSYHTRCTQSRKGHSPEAHFKTYKSRKPNAKNPNDHFPWHSPDVELIQNQRLKHVPNPKYIPQYDIIVPHKYDEFEAVFQPNLKLEAEAVIDYHAERRRGKKCDRIANIEHVCPLNTAERVFPTKFENFHETLSREMHGLTGRAGLKNHGKSQSQHQGDHVKALFETEQVPTHRKFDMLAQHHGKAQVQHQRDTFKFSL